MKTRLPLPAVFCALFTASFIACDDSSQPAENKPQTEADSSSGGGGGGTMTGGGGGDVAIGGAGDRTTIADRYKTALDLIGKRDWDGARAQLVEALNRSSGKEIQKDIREHLKLVEQGILSQSVYSAGQVLANPKFLDTSVSIRGRFLNGGDVGKVSYYFWVESGKKMQVRYENLALDEKRKIAMATDGSQVMVRGLLKPPWGSNPKPYLEAAFFRLERLASAPEGQQP